MTDNLINFLEPEDVPGLDTEDVLDVRIANRVLWFTEDWGYENEPGLAKDLYRAIGMILEKYREQLKDHQNLSIFLSAKLRMGWFAFPALDAKEKQQMIAENMVAGAKQHVDLAASIDRYVGLFETKFEQEKQIRSDLLNALTHNLEILGTEFLVLKSGEKVSNSVSNWLRDYVSYADFNSIRGGSYNLTQYLYSSINVKNLTEENKAILVQILNTYNYLKNPKISGVERQLPRRVVGAPTDATPAALPTVAAKPVTSQGFDSKLTEINNSRGASLDLLKSRLAKQPTPLVSKTPANVDSKPRLTPQEIEREVNTTELPPYKPAVPKPSIPLVKPKPLAAKVETINFAPKPKPGSIPFAKPLEITNIKPPVAPSAAPRTEAVNVVDDLKKLDINYLRAGSLKSQVNSLRSQILHLSEANNMLPYHVVLAFEESPLFKAYLAQGSAKIGGQTGISSGLTQEEFEALADLRKEIESF